MWLAPSLAWYVALRPESIRGSHCQIRNLHAQTDEGRTGKGGFVGCSREHITDARGRREKDLRRR
jgi:hypothetical protein